MAELPLSGASLFESKNPRQVEHELIRHFGILRFDLPKGDAGFEASTRHIQLPRIGIAFCKYACPVRIEFPEAGEYRQLFVLKGRGTATVNARSFTIDNANSIIVPHDAGVTLEYAAGIELFVLKIKWHAVISHLTHILGRPPARSPQFETAVDLRRHEAQRLRRLIDLIAAEYAIGYPEPPKKMLAEMEDAVIAAFVFSNRSDYSPLLEREAAASAPSSVPWQVRATEEYIEANWQRPITIENIAEHIGARPRSIFKSFKDARGYSPMVFLKRARLNQARSRLIAANEDATVTSIGLACGFNNLSHFAKDYMREFGEMPSDTLRRARDR